MTSKIAAIRHLEMTGELLAPLEWPNTSGFELSTAELNGSLQLGGQFRAAP